jgi:hypothetical protein
MPAKGFNIVRIERDGVPAQRSIEIKEGEQVTGVRVVVAYGNATLRGVINVENGTLPNGARFFVRITKLGETGPPNRGTPVDARGHFLMEGLPPGVYEVQASIGGITQNPPRPVKREINLPDGVITDISITIDLTPTTPKP